MLTPYSTKFSFSDCYEIGNRAMAANISYYAAQWLNESLKHLQSTAENIDLKLDIINRLFYAYYTESTIPFKTLS